MKFPFSLSTRYSNVRSPKGVNIRPKSLTGLTKGMDAHWDDQGPIMMASSEQSENHGRIKLKIEEGSKCKRNWNNETGSTCLQMPYEFFFFIKLITFLPEWRELCQLYCDGFPFFVWFVYIFFERWSLTKCYVFTFHVQKEKNPTPIIS